MKARKASWARLGSTGRAGTGAKLGKPMALDSPKKPFSKRFGYESQPTEIRVREDAPETLRHFVLDYLVELKYGPSSIRDTICSVLHVRPDPSNWSEYPNVWSEAQDHVYGCEWFKFYNFVEKVYSDLAKRWPNDSYSKTAEERARQFEDALNEFFLDEGIGWQMMGGEIVTRGTETFESNVHGAIEALEAKGRATARDEIHEALRDLSRRPNADLTGAVQHAMAALECVARDVCGDEKATLGEVIKRYPDTIPKPLDESIGKAWGYASEMARHIREGRKPEHREVELIVGLAATVATYLSR
jgi:hypothetical protein